MDFVVLGKEQLNWVLNVFKVYGINFKLNKFGGYKFVYEDIEIDLWLTEDLFSAFQYNVDGILFELGTKSLLFINFNDFLENGLKVVNEENNIENGREKKLIKFEKEFLGIRK